jgi:hypothetical protein
MTEDELREAAVQYLQQVTDNPKKNYEFTAKELSTMLKRTMQNVYPYMEKLVKEGVWETRVAWDPTTGHHIKVWWLIQK